MALREWVAQLYESHGEDSAGLTDSECRSTHTSNNTTDKGINSNILPSGTPKRKLVTEDNNTDGCKDLKKQKYDHEVTRTTKENLFQRMNLDQAWVSFIDFTEFDMETLIRVQNFVEEQRSLEIIYPAPKNVHRWSYLCTPDQVKVVIVGQDPYPQPHRADGLAFSTGDGCVSPSLRNIYKELHRSVDGFVIPAHGHLESWAKQGVLLLNTAFTVVRGVPGSHASIGWKTLSDRVIMQLSARRSHLVFMLWGNHAKEKMGLIDKGKHYILTSAHPSPLAATRYAGFVGNNHFIKANDYIKEHGYDPINWNSLIDHTSA
uniref:Uracil DNA glycosylase n=1 Tax=Elephant endotheliotropic herpesvirus 1A TaxID=759753 RepID=A0A866VUU3_ELHV1|nr:uracil DNA glycosylase [Elephant endotheliotropic herpesvirus 1A]WES72532.1 uracil DNA glycosylase [Elephantid betaherpesvirus 1]